MVGIKHNPVTGVNNPNYQVSKDLYNANHVIDNLSINVSKINATGTPSASNYLRGDGSWNTPSGSGSGGGISQYKFLVLKEGSNYKVYDYSGTLIISTTSFATAMNSNAFNGLTSGRTASETILTKGEMIIDNTILLPNFANVKINGKWTATPSLNKDMIANANPSSYNYMVSLEGESDNTIIDGNMANQSATSRGIYLKNTSEVPNLYTSAPTGFPSAYLLKNLTVKNCYNHNIHIDMLGSSLSQVGLDNVSAYGNTAANSDAIYLYALNDSYLRGGLIDQPSCQRYGLHLEAVYMSEISPNYLNGQHYFDVMSMCNLSVKSIVDVTGNVDALLMAGVSGNVIHDIIINSNLSGTANTYDGIKLSSDSYHSVDNVFSNIVCGRLNRWTTGTRTFKYTIEETDANQNNNIYNGINGRDCATGALRIKGANSDYGHILGSVILV